MTHDAVESPILNKELKAARTAPPERSTSGKVHLPGSANKVSNNRRKGTLGTGPKKDITMTKKICPLAEGDRVDHKIFGLGTVVGAPVGYVSPDMSSPTGTRDAGWRVDVKWDAPEQRDNSVMSFALRKVSSPDTRPFTHWDHKWQPLLQEWLRARREVERLASTFRPTPDACKLAQAMEAEMVAYKAMQAFQVEDAARVESEAVQ